jgi:hypothetical protein
MTTQTDNFGLNKPEEGNTDWATEINANWDTIDAAVGLTIVKSADESVTSSTVLQDDDDFTFSVVSGQKYKLDAFFLFYMPAAADLKYRFTSPALTASVMVGNFARANDVWNNRKTEYQLSINNTLASSANDTDYYLVRLVGAFQPSADGTLQFQWAQLNSSGSSLILKQGSWMSITKGD